MPDKNKILAKHGIIKYHYKMFLSGRKLQNTEYLTKQLPDGYFSSRELIFSFSIINILILLIILYTFSSERQNINSVSAENGIIRISQADLKQSKYIALNGNWAFHWYPEIPEITDSSIIPEKYHHFEKVPGYWKSGETGLGIYNLNIIFDPVIQIPSLKITNVMDTYKLFINGNEYYNVGTISPDIERYKDESRPVVIPLLPCSENIIVTMMVGNLTEKRGGLNRIIYFGEYETLKNSREKLLVYNSILQGISLTVIFYNLLFLLINRKKGGWNHFFLIILCLSIIFFCGLKQEMVLKTFFPDLTGEMRAKLIYMSFMLPFPVFACYIKSVYNRIFNRNTYIIIILSSLILICFVVFFKSSFFSKYLIYLEGINLILAVFLTTRLFYLYIKTRETTPLSQLIGLYIFLAGFITAILDDNLAVPSATPFILLTGFILFLTAGNTILSIRAFNRMNQLHNALITSEKDKENLRKLSYIDSLTEVSNRRHFEEYISLHWEKINFIGESTAILMIDIDNFKLFNDTYGHQEGDDCLRNVALAINSELNRENDIVFRYGGEEFAVIISNINRSGVIKIAEKLRSTVENMKIPNRNSLYNYFITISIGISIYNPETRSAGWEKVLKESDTALYRAKIKKNSVVVFDYGAEKYE